MELIDTADSYGPEVSERLIAEAHPPLPRAGRHHHEGRSRAGRPVAVAVPAHPVSFIRRGMAQRLRIARDSGAGFTSFDHVRQNAHRLGRRGSRVHAVEGLGPEPLSAGAEPGLPAWSPGLPGSPGNRAARRAAARFFANRRRPTGFAQVKPTTSIAARRLAIGSVFGEACERLFPTAGECASFHGSGATRR
jgi:hypothetical protein